MSKWNEDNFLEGLAPHLRSPGGPAGKPCPDGALLCEVVDGAANEETKKSVTEHLAQCPGCADLYARLSGLEREPALGPELESEWRLAEKRLDHWMEELLRSQTAPRRLTEAPRRWVSSGWFFGSRIKWAISLAAALMLLAVGGYWLLHKASSPKPIQTAATTQQPPASAGAIQPPQTMNSSKPGGETPETSPATRTSEASARPAVGNRPSRVDEGKAVESTAPAGGTQQAEPSPPLNPEGQVPAMASGQPEAGAPPPKAPPQEAANPAPPEPPPPTQRSGATSGSTPANAQANPPVLTAENKTVPTPPSNTTGQVPATGSSQPGPAPPTQAPVREPGKRPTEPSPAPSSPPATAQSYPPAAAGGGKKRVAILNFDYATVQTSVAAIFGTNQDVGKGISDLLVQKLVGDGRYSVIERSALDKILAEQNFSNSDRADSATAAKIGRALGVDAIIIGSITQFGRDDKSTGVAGGAIGNLAGHWGFGHGGVGQQNAKAVVGITARLVDTSTGEVLAAVTGQGESTRSGLMLGGGGGNSGGAGGGHVDMASSNFGETILGEAVHKAVDNVGQQLDQRAGALATQRVQVSGLVADVTGNTLVLNVGSKAGVKVGDQLTVSRKVKDVKDPSTGTVIKRIVDPVGTAIVTEVDELSATATFSGGAPAKVGDIVRNQ
jgi:curli biogenesis system outer membrane secretion channel CsgG